MHLCQIVIGLRIRPFQIEIGTWAFAEYIYAKKIKINPFIFQYDLLVHAIQLQVFVTYHYTSINVICRYTLKN